MRLWQSLPPTETFIAWTKAPSQQASPVIWRVPISLPAHPTVTVRPDFLTDSVPGLLKQSWMSHSIKPFIHSALTLKELKLMPLRRIPTKKPLGSSSQSHQAWVLLFLVSLWFLTSLSIHLQQSSLPLLSERFGNSCSCYVSVSIHLAGTTYLHALLLSQRWAVHSLLSQAPTQSCLQPSYLN